MATDDPLLHALGRRIQATVKDTGRCLITAPVEIAPLKAMTPDDLRGYAANLGMTVVPRLGFSQVEFFTVHLPRVAAGLV
jgi:hypothetical protein